MTGTIPPPSRRKPADLSLAGNSEVEAWLITLEQASPHRLCSALCNPYALGTCRRRSPLRVTKHRRSTPAHHRPPACRGSSNIRMKACHLVVGQTLHVAG